MHQSVGLSSKSEVMLAISDAFKAKNIPIPYPITTIKMDTQKNTTTETESTIKDQRADANLDE